MIKKSIKALLRLGGYQISQIPSSAQDIVKEKYRWLQEMGISTVLDIGANTGQFAEFIRPIIPQAMIYSFEPLKSCYQELVSKTSSLKPIQCFPFALGKEEAVMNIHHNEFSPSSSMLPVSKKLCDAFPYAKHAIEEQITVCSLDSIAQELLLKFAILAKIDVQGYELNVLLGAEKTLPLIDVFIIETSFVELYEAQPLFDDVYQFMKDHHFLYAGDFDQIVDPSNGAVLQSDSIFLNMRKGIKE